MVEAVPNLLIGVESIDQIHYRNDLWRKEALH